MLIPAENAEEASIVAGIRVVGVHSLRGLLDALDCPDPSTTTPRRAVTTTPLQALVMLNNALVLQLADRFAERLVREAPGSVDRQVRLGEAGRVALVQDDLPQAAGQVVRRGVRAGGEPVQQIVSELLMLVGQRRRLGPLWLP